MKSCIDCNKPLDLEKVICHSCAEALTIKGSDFNFWCRKANSRTFIKADLKAFKENKEIPTPDKDLRIEAYIYMLGLLE